LFSGEGVMGTIASGCPETFAEVEGSSGRGGGGDPGRRFEDMHQKLENFRRGDVFASLAGVSQWWYNRGDSDAVIVIVLDVTNRENQLDQVPRVIIKFKKVQICTACKLYDYHSVIKIVIHIYNT